METRFKHARRPVGANRYTGVKLVPKEVSAPEYQDLKSLKNAQSFVPELDQPTDEPGPRHEEFKSPLISNPVPDHDLQNETKGPVFETSGLVPKFPLETSPDRFKQPNLPFPIADEKTTKTAAVPELPLLEARDFLENLKKEELQATPQAGTTHDYDITHQPESEDIFPSRTNTVTNVRRPSITETPRPEWNFFTQRQCRQTPEDFFTPCAVKYTTKRVLQGFVTALPESGTHGCIVEEGYYAVGNQYTENVHFLKEKELGSGSFGSVDLVRDSVSGKTMVRKQVAKDQLRDVEVIIPLNVESDNVTKIIGLKQKEEGERLIMELFLEFAGTALNMYLNRERRTLTPANIRSLTKQSLRGLFHIHKYGMIHLDIKPENMLIQDINGVLHLKITDFGSAKLPYNDIVFIGWTPEYMAQESCQYFLQTKHDFKYGLTEDDITGKVDVFALFLVILYMYSKKHVLLSLMTNGKGSYSGYSLEERQAIHMQLIVMMAQTGIDGCSLIDDKCDLNMRYLLNRMSSPREERATARQALDIIERIEQEELQAQRAKELKLVQQKAQRREIVPEISFNFPNMNQLCLPVAVPVPCNKILRKSEVMERLRNKVTNVTPYKKIHKQEVPTMPQTPVEEMQKLQIMLGTSDRMAKDEHDAPNTQGLAMIQEESMPNISITGITFPDTTTTMGPTAEEGNRTTGDCIIVDASLMPAPALINSQPLSPRINMVYEDFIDLQTEDNPALQGNMPKILFE